MKIAGRRIPKGSSLLFVSYTAVSLCLLVIVSAVRADRENNLSKNNMYTGHESGFYIDGSVNEKQWEEVIPDVAAARDDFAVYVSVPDQEILMRGICIKGEVAAPPMIQGEYFDLSTSWTDQPTMVLGKAYQKDAGMREGTMYYTWNDREYKVIGIMGTEKDSRINHMILMDFRSAIQVTGVNTDYVLDTRKKEEMKNVGLDIDELFREPAMVVISLGGDTGEIPLMQRLLSSDAIVDTVYVMILVSFSLSTILVTSIWLRFRRSLFTAWVLCGYERRWEWGEIAKRYYRMAGLGFVMGLVLEGALAWVVPEIHMAAADVLLALGMTLGLGTVILLICYVRKVSRAIA